MVQINTFDYGRAVGQGTQNALNTLKARQGIRDVKRQRAMSETAQQLGDDYNYEDHANALRKQGYTQAANALTQQGQQARGQQMRNQLDQMKLVSATAPMARDQRSWDRVRERWIKFGADPESLPEQFDPDFVRHMAGKAQEDLSKNDLVQVQGPEGRPVFVRASRAEGMSPYQKPDKPDISATNVALPSGERVRGRKVDGELQVMGPDNSWQPAPRGAQMVGVSLSGSEEDVGLGNTEARNLRDQKVAAMNFVDTTRDALELLKENPDVNTWTASGASVINNLQQEAKALARATGKEFDEDVLNPSKYREQFSDLGIQSERMKSMFVSLAFQAATASGQTGRSVSDQDIKRFMQQVGKSSSSPQAMAQVLHDLADRTVRNYKNNVEGRTGERPGADLGLSQLPGFQDRQPGPTRERAAEPEVEIDDETQRLLEKYQ